MAGVPGFEPGECQSQSLMPYRLAIPQRMVEEDRFELPNPEGIDLQSTAFGHFATPPISNTHSGFIILNTLNKKMVDAEGLEPPTLAL